MSVELDFNLNQALQDKLSSSPVLFIVPKQWKSLANKALKDASPMSLGITATSLKALRKKLKSTEVLNCYEYAILSNNLEKQTPKSMDVSDEVYDDVMIMVEKFTESWNAQTNGFRDEILQNIASKKLQPPLVKE